MLFRRTALRRTPTGVGNTFAATCPPIKQGILDHATTLHRGYNLYRSFTSCNILLSALFKNGWCPTLCEEMLNEMKNSDCHFLAPMASSQTAIYNYPYYPVISVEGLDGVGKSIFTQKLAEKLNGKRIMTPNPKYDHLRAQFRVAPEPIARCFYCASNYLGAREIIDARREQVVVVDRWFASTCAMAYAALAFENYKLKAPKQEDLLNPDPEKVLTFLPPEKQHLLKLQPKQKLNQNKKSAADEEFFDLYAWPSDLPQPDFKFLLDCPEEIRLKRMELRGGHNQEEKLLAEQAAMRTSAMEVYRRMDYEVITVPNYAYAVNAVLERLEAARVKEPERFVWGITEHNNKTTTDAAAASVSASGSDSSGSEGKKGFSLLHLKYSDEECASTACY